MDCRPIRRRRHADHADHAYGHAILRSAGLSRPCSTPNIPPIQGNRLIEIRVGYELIYDLPQSTPMIMVLGIHFTRASDIVRPDYLTTTPSLSITPYRDQFGNWC